MPANDYSDEEILAAAGLLGDAPLNVRNNNPGNIRGQDGGFREFSSPDEGMEALKQDLLLKINGESQPMQGRFGAGYQPTLANVIRTWAPETENDTAGYIRNVAMQTGLNPDRALTPQDLEALVPAMIQQEGGKQARTYYETPQEPEPSDEEILEALGQNTPPAQPQVATPRDPGAMRTFLDQSGQGLSFATLDEGQDALGALFAKGYDKVIGDDLYNGQSVGELYNLARQESQPRLEDEWEQYPKTAFAGNLLGAAVGGLTGGTTAAGKLLGRGLSSGNAAIRLGAGAATGTVSGAAYGYGSGEADRAGSAAEGALYGGATGGLLPVAGAALRKLNTKTIIPRSEEIRAAGSKLYQLADQTKAALKAPVVDSFLDEVVKIRPQTEAGKIFKGNSAVADILDQVPSLKGKPLTLQAAQEVDEALGDLAYSTMDKFGKLTSEGAKFLDMQTKLRRTIDNASEDMIEGGKAGFEAIKEARKYWSASLRARDVEKIIDNAQYYEQPATAIRTGFRTLLRNPDRLKGYSKEEIKAFEKAAKTGIVTDAFRLAGSGLVPIGAGITGAASGGLLGGLGAAAVGSAVQQGAKAIGAARQSGRAKDALRTVAEKSGMVTTEQRISIPALKELMAMPPAAAQKLLNSIKK